MRRPAETKFESEAALCATFLERVRADSAKEWVAYNETEGWDILLVRPADGVQVGVQAKMKLNTDVMAQALDGRWSWERGIGPDYRAVLVPRSGVVGAITSLCAYVGLTVISIAPPAEMRRYSHSDFDPSLPSRRGDREWNNRYWYDWCPLQRHPLPDYIPDVAAGASAPVQLTRWKIAAIKIAVTLEIRGFVTRADFKHIGIDSRRWTLPRIGWLKPVDGRYVANFFPNFKRIHPRVYEEIKADAAKWMLADPGPAAVTPTEAML